MRISSRVRPCVGIMQPMRTQWRTLWGFDVHRVTRIVPFLTCCAVALHQARLSNLNVEGFVLLVLLVIDYFHLDGFTGREEKERGRKEKGGRREGRKSEERTGWKLEDQEEMK